MGLILLILKWVAITFLALTVIQVLVYRFIPVRTTPLMRVRCHEQRKRGEKTRVHHRWIPFKDIPQDFKTAVWVGEDGHFIGHFGFDIAKIYHCIKSYFHNREAFRKAFGGMSTISQQTAKNAFLPHSRTMLRKALEAYYTLMIETFWSKRRIMEVYLNIVEFGDGIYGAEAAAKHYFGHSAKTLSRKEAAQLAATLPAPLLRNPGHSTPYFRRYTSIIQKRVGGSRINIDKPNEKRQKKFDEKHETLWDFVKWYLEN